MTGPSNPRPGEQEVVSKAIEELPLWLKTTSVRRRSRWERWASRLTPRPRERQGVFAFVERARRVERAFKLAIAVITLALIAGLLAFLPSGRYLAGWTATRGQWAALRALGTEPGRESINADWARRREFDIRSATGRYRRTFEEYTEAQKGLLRHAGMDPDHVLIRWGNFDRTVMLPSTIYQADDSGRSYRMRPRVRSIWVRNFPVKGDVKAFFQIPDSPDAAKAVERTGVTIVEGSSHSTNSLGLRGPEPDRTAPWRGIVLGDSYMQGLFVADSQTPTECLKRDLAKRLGGRVEVLNTGHLGYSPEQYYYSLVEYARDFPPQFVVVSLFANDFAGDLNVVIEGRGGDWDEAKYWLGQIRDFCAARDIPCIYVPAPWLNQLEGPQRSGYYPGLVSNATETNALMFLDPINDFADAFLAVEAEGLKRGEPVKGNPLFNGRIGDGHFSASGCEIWAERVGRRVSLLLDRGMAIRAGNERNWRNAHAPAGSP